MGDEREKLEGKSCTTKFGELHSDTIFNILSLISSCFLYLCINPLVFLKQ